MKLEVVLLRVLESDEDPFASADVWKECATIAKYVSVTLVLSLTHF